MLLSIKPADSSLTSGDEAPLAKMYWMHRLLLLGIISERVKENNEVHIFKAYSD